MHHLVEQAERLLTLRETNDIGRGRFMVTMRDLLRKIDLELTRLNGVQDRIEPSEVSAPDDQGAELLEEGLKLRREIEDVYSQMRVLNDEDLKTRVR